MNEVFKLISEGERLDQKEMAQILGMSEEAVEEQLEQLKKSGAFLGWIPVLNPEEGSENAVRGLIEVKLTPERGGGFNRLAQRISRFEEVIGDRTGFRNPCSPRTHALEPENGALLDLPSLEPWVLGCWI